MSKSRAAVFAIALSFTFSAAAHAAPVSFSATFNLNTPGVFSNTFINSGGTGIGFSGLVPALVAVGDQVDITYTFGGQGVSASSVMSGWANVWDWNPITEEPADGGPYETVNMTGTFSLLDFSASAIFTSDLLFSSEGAVHIGQSFGLSTGPLVFYGIKYSGTLLSSSPSTARTYNLPGLTLSGTNFVTVEAVPLPAALPLLTAALGAMGFMGWRRKRKA